MDRPELQAGRVPAPRGYRAGLVTAAGLALACLLVASAGATPPSAMSLAYDADTHLLSVSITHASANTLVHYIREVSVSLNGRVINDSHYTTQPDPSMWTYTYPVTAQPGDVLSATASCSLFGSATRSITLTAESGAAGQPVTAATTSQKSAPGAVLLAVPAAFALLALRKKRS